MQKHEIVEIINDFLINEFEIEESKLVPGAHLKNDLGLESLDYVDIAVIVEEKFGFKIKGEDMGNVLTLDMLYDYIFTRSNQ
ncbi:MAG: phosphopantetheine-binding protein [Bacteroidales bacterium]|nr:phosphopantetheine-binding protein [Bacteroidales bacterium]